MIPTMLTRDELYAWMRYFKYKPPEVQEIQMAILISSVRNAMSSKNPTKPKDFIFSNMDKKKQKGVIEVDGFNSISEESLKDFIKF